jgi:glucosamine-6-phosphate deaminase
VITFNLDEYLDLDQRFMNQSYAYFMNEHLFNDLNIRRENIHFPNEKQKGSVFHQMVQQAGGIDLAILGIGTNGHIAFNEPGSVINSTTRIVELKESTRLSNAKFFNNNINLVPKKAISVGLDLIRTAKRVVIIATGKDKYEAVQHLLKATQYDKE